MQRFVPVARRRTNRLAFIAGVAATHAVIIATFLMNDTLQMPEHISPAKEITLILRRIIPALPQRTPQTNPHKTKSNAITLPPVLPNSLIQNDLLQRLGKTLACRANYDNLSPEERAHCALQPWTAPDAASQLMLGAERPSIWAQELAERKAPFVSMFNPCETGAIGPDADRGRLGLACTRTDPAQAKRWGKLLQ